MVKRLKLMNIVMVSIVVLLVAGLTYLFWIEQNKLPVIGIAPSFSLENLEGEEVSLEDLEGKVKVVEFIFTNCPDICPMTTVQLVTIQEKLKQQQLFGKEVVFVAITFDPEFDTVEVLKQYVEGHGMDPSGWVVLRGTEEATHKVARDYGILVQKIGNSQFLHKSEDALILIDRSNTIRKKYDMGNGMPTEEVQKDILGLVKE